MNRIQHYAIRYWIIALITNCALYAVADTNPIITIVMVAMLGGILTAAVAEIRHRLYPCPLCATDIPDNGGQLAERHAWSLWLHHATHSPAGVLTSVGVIAAAIFVWSWPVSAVLTTLLVAELVADVRHRRLIPWCPHCRDDEDDGDFEDDPLPTEDARRTA